MTIPSARDDADALRVRIAELEKALSNPDVIPTQSVKKSSPKPSPVKESAPHTSEKPRREGNRDIFEKVNEFVRAFGEKQPITKFFLESSVIKKEKNTLKIIALPIGASTMKMSGAEAVALSIAKELDPEIEKIEILEGDVASGNDGEKNNDLSQFDN